MATTTKPATTPAGLKKNNPPAPSPVKTTAKTAVSTPPAKRLIPAVTQETEDSDEGSDEETNIILSKDGKSLTIVIPVNLLTPSTNEKGNFIVGKTSFTNDVATIPTGKHKGKKLILSPITAFFKPK